MVSIVQMHFFVISFDDDDDYNNNDNSNDDSGSGIGFPKCIQCFG